ncbi:tol-pal system protein YbgF [Pseudooceanicola sediminis]|uniref:Cell division coordinator CpoB n=1 Tax=Pseudooceanicola sediminis TaxID=2211117 RepID=A0A399J3V2_9RHOB|nr:tol-pal system protein YbgF [Pseudooceanicola sediminis]KAA2314123.1 tol-pal system protein YbgF [Puniceibacterium sp. HSS470]RII40015.1 tol-pal system protein YbgF [Pseudooceanicola sediminis]
MRRILFTVLCLLTLPVGTAIAQDRDETLADIRQQLTTLHVQIQNLKRELSTTGATGGMAVSTDPLERLNAIESELRRLTGKTEELEHRIESVVTDGTNKIGDLEFRLVELEGGDVSKLGTTTTLGSGTATSGTASSTGGGSQAAVSPPPASDATPSTGATSPELAIGEEADFQAAQEKLASGDYAGAINGFETFKTTYPGSPLSPAVQLGMGRALEGQGDTKTAARAYLDSFSLDPQGQTAPVALFRLGRLLAELGQTNEACVTLGEVSKRFPGSSTAEQANGEMRAQGCT